MRFRKIALALFACLALGAIAANAAQAEGTVGWTIGTTENQSTPGTPIPVGTHERVKCHKHGTSALVFTSKLLGSTVELEAEGIDCLEKQGSTNLATIDNTTTKNHSEGVLTFTNVKVLKPSNCSVGGASHDLTTNPLTDTVIMDPTAGSTVVFDKFFTHSGPFIEIEFEGALCALAEDSAPVNGAACGEAAHTSGSTWAPNPTGTLTKVQTLTFGMAQQTTAKCALTFGPEEATLDGDVDNELAGANAGSPFGSGG